MYLNSPVPPSGWDGWTDPRAGNLATRSPSPNHQQTCAVGQHPAAEPKHTHTCKHTHNYYQQFSQIIMTFIILCCIYCVVYLPCWANSHTEQQKGTHPPAVWGSTCGLWWGSCPWWDGSPPCCGSTSPDASDHTDWRWQSALHWTGLQRSQSCQRVEVAVHQMQIFTLNICMK